MLNSCSSKLLNSYRFFEVEEPSQPMVFSAFQFGVYQRISLVHVIRRWTLEVKVGKNKAVHE
jgi:hypothetical protein